MIRSIANLYFRLTDAVVRATDGWLLGLLARLAFAAVLFVYFFNSALTKFDGFEEKTVDAIMTVASDISKGISLLRDVIAAIVSILGAIV